MARVRDSTRLSGVLKHVDRDLITRSSKNFILAL
jgi:hypothetical protein